METWVKKLNSQYMARTNENTKVISDPEKANKDATAKWVNSGPHKVSRFNPIYVEPGSTSINSTKDLQALYPNSFDRIGDMLGEYDIKIDPTVLPVQNGRCKVPIEYNAEIEKELGEMVSQGIIVKQTEPTPWVSSLTYPKKPNGKLRICLDPKDLNKAIIRENHKARTLEEIAHILTGATKFSKVDGNKAFFGMHLTKEASLLMTFNTHLDRYWFLRVPFRLKMSQDIFQMRMDDIVTQCPGVFTIHDDICIYGKDGKEHDANLINLFMLPKKSNLFLIVQSVPSNKILWHSMEEFSLSKDTHQILGKIQGITEMSAPQTKQELQSFLDAVNYLQTFIPHRSHHTEPLQVLLTEGEHIHMGWKCEQQLSKNQGHAKNMILELLKYYDRNKLVTRQCDASKKSLGACILQEGNVMCSYTSLTIRETETLMSNELYI